MNKPLQDYVTLHEASEITGLSEHNLRYWCSKGKIKGAIKLCKTWIIPRSSIRPTCTYYPHKLTSFKAFTEAKAKKLKRLVAKLNKDIS